ncbi:YCF48-related protein [Flavobacterium psychrotolerans]|uniref:Photosystem II stability/assembly factor-like protein n=1 Tax=Flavobacterium psychrotolerans TaxID=2169410 RepID=A0A2U1JHG6_9FLAO|nr:YCF48-related protein [Flavobacterium psychrotolerans]PWA04610.1 photosystem II stability/assembly factor-like protein [Flavobacterium psychrotolerans]
MKKYYYLLLLFSISLTAQLQWRPLTSILSNGNNQRFDDVFFLNENLGWALNGAYAAVFKTTDGGTTWTQQLSEKSASLPGNYYFRNIEFLNENVGFVGTLNGAFFKTVDGGNTWTTVTNFSTNPPAICGLDTVGATTVYGCGAYFSPAYIIKSIDSGETWQFIDMSAYANALVEILFLDENIGYVSGKSTTGGVVLKTTDGGNSWTEIYNTNIAGEYVWKLQILGSDSKVLFGSVETEAPNTGRLIQSLDAGVNWTSKVFPDTNVQAVGFLTEKHGWMGGHATGFYETTDGGDTWTNTTIGSNLNRIFILNDNLAYASGTTIYKFNDSNLATTDFVEKARMPLKAFVQPNPVKDKLNVTIGFTESDHVIIELYDSLGHRIKELQKDDINKASSKTYTFDFPYSTGVYIINLHTNTGRQSIKFVK